MPRPREELTAGEWAVLALLTEAPAHGFALARALASDGEVGRVWTVRRPLVYRAIEVLRQRELVTGGTTVASPTGPQRTIVEPTQHGRHAVAGWVGEPVQHVRDARSLLMLKLLFLSRAGADPGPLLRAQRTRFVALADGLAKVAAGGDDFDRVLALWRLETTSAALRFVETMLSDPRPAGSAPRS